MVFLPLEVLIVTGLVISTLSFLFPILSLLWAGKPDNKVGLTYIRIVLKLKMEEPRVQGLYVFKLCGVTSTGTGS